MEKLIYLLTKQERTSIEAFRSHLLERSLEELRGHGASHITINVADLNDEINANGPGRLIGPWHDLTASIAFWHPYADSCAPITAGLRAISASCAGYLVTESVPQNCETTWEGGTRRPGVTQFGANGKPQSVSEEDFYRNWQLHSLSSFELHPLRWSYVRNAVARPLTEEAPAYRCIVFEHFHSLEDFCDDSRYFGSEDAVQTMLEEVAGFCDFNNMVSLGMSEYYFA